MSIWQLIESPPADIFFQMEEDRLLFEAFVSEPGAFPVLRIYRVSGPGITLGRARRSSLPKDICIRPTGGGLVRHGNDFLYSVMARRDTFPTFHQVRTSYLSFHEVVQEAFWNLGIETTLFRCDDLKARKNAKEPHRLEDCFEKPVPTDVSFEDKKIAGGAQWRRKEAFLHQGSVQLIQGVSFERLKPVFLEAFEKRFGQIVRTSAQLTG